MNYTNLPVPYGSGRIFVLDEYFSHKNEASWADDTADLAVRNRCAAVVCFGNRNWLTMHYEYRIGQRFLEFLQVPEFNNAVQYKNDHKVWTATLEAVRSLLERGNNVLFIAKFARWHWLHETLAALGLPYDVVETLSHLPHANETVVEQDRWVALGEEHAPVRSVPSVDVRRDRAIGALLGLAVGDALGAPFEFHPKLSVPKAYVYRGGGPFELAPGQWTDDTAMALALATSLRKDPALDPNDLMDRFVAWWKSGTYSCTGTCFDIGATTVDALSRYVQTGEPIAGRTSPFTAGNGALMRLAPVAIRHWNDRANLERVADLQTRVTHGAEEARAASVAFASLLAHAIEGGSPSEVLTRDEASVFPRWREASRETIRGSGYVVHAFEASLWCVSRTTSFASAVQLAANLGEDADTTAAITGQFAGALYGAQAIEQVYLRDLAMAEELATIARELFDASIALPP